MFLTSLVYILGLCAYQLHYPVLYSVCITIVLGLLCILNLIKPKYLFVWILTFYIGLFNAMLRISDSDILKNIAPVDGSFTGQIVSIPNSNIENNSKFFFKVTKADYEHKTIDKINSKLLVSVTDKENSEEFVIKRFEAGDTTGESYRYVQVHEKLPFTRQEYRAYYKTYFLEGSTLEPGRTIEESLKTRGLTRYFAPNRITQKEWRNSIIEQFAPKNSIKRFFYMLRHRIKQIIR